MINQRCGDGTANEKDHAIKPSLLCFSGMEERLFCCIGNAESTQGEEDSQTNRKQSKATKAKVKFHLNCRGGFRFEAWHSFETAKSDLFHLREHEDFLFVTWIFIHPLPLVGLVERF